MLEFVLDSKSDALDSQLLDLVGLTSWSGVVVNLHQSDSDFAAAVEVVVVLVVVAVFAAAAVLVLVLRCQNDQVVQSSGLIFVVPVQVISVLWTGFVAQLASEALSRHYKMSVEFCDCA